MVYLIDLPRGLLPIPLGTVAVLLPLAYRLFCFYCLVIMESVMKLLNKIMLSLVFMVLGLLISESLLTGWIGRKK